MKLTELSGPELLDTLERLAAPMGRLAEDRDLGRALQELSGEQEGHPICRLLRAVALLAPSLRRHGDDLVEVAAALSGQAESEVRRMGGLKLVALLRDSLDEALAAFFSSAGDTGHSASPAS